MRTLPLMFVVAALASSGTDAYAQAPSSNVQLRAAIAGQAAAPSAAEIRIAFVDMDRVVAVSAEGKAASARLDDLRAKKSAEVAERSKQVQALQDKLSAGATVLNDVARARLQREFQRAQVNFQRFSEDAQAELHEAQQQALQSFNAQLFPVIRQVAAEKNLWAVFGSDSGLLWFNPAADLTDEIAKRLDAAAVKR